MTLAAILAKHRGEVVPAVPVVFRGVGTPESQARRSVPVVPAVPVQIQKGSLTVEAIRAHLLALADSELIAPTILETWTADDFAACDGLPDETLRACLRALCRSTTMDGGTVPVDYTQAALCESCGPVWLWQGAPALLWGCPWCIRRKAGKGFARPLVTCGPCRHFLPDSINPAVGGGACDLRLPPRRGQAGRWPMAPRACDSFELRVQL